MKELGKKIDLFTRKARSKTREVCNKAYGLFRNEDGDTNFLSIIIILAIVLLLAIVFIAFKDKIVELINNTWDTFSTAFGNQGTSNPGGVNVPGGNV